MGDTLERIRAFFGGGQSIPEGYYQPSGAPMPSYGEGEYGPQLPARQSGGSSAFSTLSPEQRSILGYAALSDAFAALGGRPTQGFAGMAPLIQTLGEQAQNERFRQANQQLRQQLFGGQAGGSAPLSAPQAQIVGQAGQTGQMGFSPAGLAINTRLESGGRPDARSATSSALGPNQFTEGTFLEFAAANPNLFPNMSREQILRERTSPEISAMATQWYAGRNASVLQNAGLPVTDATLGLAHQFGGPVAARILQAAPETPIADIVGQRVMDANRSQLEGRTAGDIVGSFARSYSGAQQRAAPAGAVPGAPTMPSQRRPMITAQEFDAITNLLPPGAANQAIIQAMTRQAPQPLVIDGTAYDPVTLQPLVTAPQRPGENERFYARWRELSDIPEANRTAVQNQELEMLSARLRGGGTNISLNTAETMNREFGQLAAREFMNVREVARAAPTLALRAERIDQLINSGAITGTGANFLSSVANALATAGIIPPDVAANTQMLAAELAGSALQASQLLKGPTSDRDIKFLTDVSAGNIAFNEQTLRRLSRLNADLAERAVREYNRISPIIQRGANYPEEFKALFEPINWQEENERARAMAESSSVRTRPGGPAAPPPGSTIIPFQPPRATR